MIEKFGTFDNLDTWLPDEELAVKYKTDVLGKFIDLPEEERKPQQLQGQPVQRNPSNNNGIFIGGNPDLFGSMP